MAAAGGGQLEADLVERYIRVWLHEVVVGLGLCPYAAPIACATNLRIAVSTETRHVAMQRDFLRELDLIQSSTEEDIATTLLAFPCALADFDDYLEFLHGAEQGVVAAGLDGVVQLASFHPRYRFAGEAAGAASHYSNRAPYPVVHLLREDMLSRVLAEDADPEAVPTRNIARLEAMGAEELERRWRHLFGQAVDSPC